MDEILQTRDDGLRDRVAAESRSREALELGSTHNGHPIKAPHNGQRAHYGVSTSFSNIPVQYTFGVVPITTTSPILYFLFTGQRKERNKTNRVKYPYSYYMLVIEYTKGSR